MAKRKNNDKFTLMTTGSVPGVIVSLALPSMVINIITALYNMADTFFVGNLGTSQVAAVGIGFPLMNVIQAFGFLFGQGAANYMSRVLGAQDHDAAERMAVTGLVTGIAMVSLVTIFGLIFRGPLVMLLGATPTIRPYAVDYIVFILLAAPFMVGATVLNQELRFQGAASIAMVGMVTGSVLNVLLDPLFIYVFGWGVAGASAATMLSQMTSFCILLFYGSSREGIVHIKVKKFSPSPGRYLELFRGGLPSLFRQGLNSVSTIIINHFAGVYGDAAIAGISIVNRIIQFANSLMLGFGQGFQPVCGYNYGAKKYGRVKQGYFFSIKAAFVWLLIISVLLAVFAPQVVAIFRRGDAEVIRVGALNLRFCCMSLPFICIAVITNQMTQTMGMVGSASLIGIARRGLFLVPALFILTPFLGLTGILLAKPVGEFCAIIMTLPIARHVLTKKLTLDI
jgi:putative MATE family efflux protein